ncbi:MAG: endonuclease/exonuclease/phosphatase family protein [Planctomycetota bacterium]
MSPRLLSSLLLSLVLGVGVLVPSPAALADGIRVGIREAKPNQPGTIRLASYNLENLFDNKDDPRYSDRNEDIDDYKPVEERRALEKAIREIDADVLAVQEIESLEALLEFRDDHLKGMGYDHVVSIDVGQSRGIENAVLSRFPLKDARVWPNLALGGIHPEMYGDQKNWYAGEPITFRRSPLRVTVEIPAERAGGEAYELVLFNVHNKSGRHNRYWREAEGRKIVSFIQYIEGENPGANIAVLGDFNAQRGEPSVDMYLTDAAMLDVWGTSFDPDASEQWTHASNRRIDLILVNKGLSREIVEGSAFCLGTPMIPRGANWRTTPPPPGYASDHVPVVVDIVPTDR